NPPVINTLVNALPIANGTQIEFKGTAEANETVNLFMDGGASPVGTTVADQNGNFDVTTTAPVADGEHGFTASVTDAHGLTSGLPAPGTVGVIPSKPVITTLVGVPVNGATVELKGTAEAGETVHLFADGGDTLVGTGIADGGGNFDITTLVTFADGVHSFTANEIDSANLTSQASDAFSVALLPSKQGITTLATAPVQNGGFVELQGTAEANDSIVLFADGSGVVVGTGTADLNGNFDITTDVTFTDAVHSFTAKATDAASLTSAASD